MPSTHVAPPPGAQALTRLRARARAARRTALIALTGQIALLSCAQSLAERAATGQEAPQAVPPLAVLSLILFAGGLPVLAVTQAAWGSRERAARRRERELYAVRRETPGQPLSRLVMACGWAVTLLLGFTLPRLFEAAGWHGLASASTTAVEALSLVSVAAGVCFVTWWARDALGIAARAVRRGRPPADPWDPGRGRSARPARSAALWTGAGAAVAVLAGTRAHLWEPPAAVLCALAAATLVCGLVTDE
ncbi:hypothetical protein [Nonomuraea cavernae]|nr:hypothetical protein [Nonomuraea cavernae]MCA2187709.1 hypothetical protein [Nonomuraea cavernae]